MEVKDQRPILLEGIRVGLKAFIITYGLALILSIIVNISLMGKIQDYLQGTLVNDVGINFGLIVKTTALLMNMSVFNAFGAFKFGLLIFVVLPFLAFYLADRRDNREKGMGFVGFVIYVIASMVFTALLQLLAFISQGDFLGVDISFLSMRNVIMTFVVTMLIQMTIGINYDMHSLPGIRGTRCMFRIVFGFALVVSVIGMIYGLSRFTSNPALIALAVLMLVLNVAVYLLFMMMGISVDFNSELEQLIQYGHIDVSYSMIPITIRIGLMAIFVIAIFISLYRMKDESYIKSIAGFAIGYPLLCYLMAVCTEIHLGGIKFIGNIHFGINLTSALIYPFIAIIAVSLFDLLLRRMQKILND